MFLNDVMHHIKFSTNVVGFARFVQRLFRGQTLKRSQQKITEGQLDIYLKYGDISIFDI